MVCVNWSHMQIQKFLDERVTQYPRFKALQKRVRSKEANAQNKNFVWQVAGPFGLVLALLGINASNKMPSAIELAQRMVVSVVVYDFGLYLVHCMQHTHPLAKHFHQAHHKVQLYAVDVTKGDPVDFFEFFIPMIITPWYFQSNIFEVWAMCYILQMHGCIVHSGQSIAWLDTLCNAMHIVGPRFHALHHVKHSSNYGVVFTLWDEVFGTCVTTDEMNVRLN